jgi:hypothetical protein
MARRAGLEEGVLLVALSATLITAFGSAMPEEAYAVDDSRTGTVLSIDQFEGSPPSPAIVLSVGPWRLKDADRPPGSAPLRIKLKPTTDVQVVTRAKSADVSGRVGVLSRTPANMRAVQPGSYVTVTFAQSGTELTAERIEVMAEPLELYPAPPPAPSSLVIQPKQ